MKIGKEEKVKRLKISRGQVRKAIENLSKLGGFSEEDFYPIYMAGQKIDQAHAKAIINVSEKED